MKKDELFSDEAVTRRSQEAARALDVAARSAKAKRMLDNAAMDKKERRPLKEFSDLRMELSEGIQEHVNIAHSSMPPNILILRRKTVRQFPNQTMVALYYNDKLDQYFSIPYGGEVSSVVTPVALAKEEVVEEGKKKVPAYVAGALNRDFIPIWAKARKEEEAKEKKKLKEETLETLAEDHQVGDEVRYRLGAESHLRVGKVKQVMPEHLIVHRTGSHYKVPKGSVVHNSRTGYTREELNEGVISHLQKIKAFQTNKPLMHNDGSQTKIDPQTANALLTVHGALHPDNQKKFAGALEHSKDKFHKMVDFAWKQVK